MQLDLHVAHLLLLLLLLLALLKKPRPGFPGKFLTPPESLGFKLRESGTNLYYKKYISKFYFAVAGINDRLIVTPQDLDDHL